MFPPRCAFGIWKRRSGEATLFGISLYHLLYNSIPHQPSTRSRWGAGCDVIMWVLANSIGSTLPCFDYFRGWGESKVVRVFALTHWIGPWANPATFSRVPLISGTLSTREPITGLDEHQGEWMANDGAALKSALTIGWVISNTIVKWVVHIALDDFMVLFQYCVHHIQSLSNIAAVCA